MLVLYSKPHRVRHSIPKWKLRRCHPQEDPGWRRNKIADRERKDLIVRHAFVLRLRRLLFALLTPQIEQPWWIDADEIGAKWKQGEKGPALHTPTCGSFERRIFA